MYKHLKQGQIVESSIEIKKSTFIGTCTYVENEEEAKKFVSFISNKYSDATHNCYAYIFDTLGNALKFSDNGEPQGTAGMPILEVIRNKKLVQTAVVVTRYFGGIKLGAGGLVRAYTDAAVECLNKATVVVENEGVYFDMTVDYNLFKPVQLMLDTMEDIENLGIDYSDVVKISLVTKVELFDGYVAKFIDLCNGKCTIDEWSRDFYAFAVKD